MASSMSWRPHDADAAGSTAGAGSAAPRHRPRCAMCGSRRFKRDPTTLLVVCQEGHVLQGFRDEEADDDMDFASRSQTRSKRSVTKQRRRRTKRSTAARGVWRGDRGYFRLYQCLQLLLRLQVAALRAAWPDLPPEIEPVIRDLWAMLVSTHDRLHPAPLDELAAVLEEQQERASRSHSVSSSRARSRSRSRAASPLAPSEAEIEKHKAKERAAEERRRRRTLRRQMADLGEVHASSSSSDEDVAQGSGTEGSSTWESEGDARRGRPNESTSRRPRNTPLADIANADTLLAVLYIGLTTLKIPIMWKDLIDLVKERRLPYMHALHVLPPELVKPLPALLAMALDAQHVPEAGALHDRSVHIATRLGEIYEVRFADLNAPPVLWRITAEMLLPPTFYTATRSLCSFLRTPMSAFPEGVTADDSAHWSDSEGQGSEKRSRRPLPKGLEVIGPESTGWPRCVLLCAALLVIIRLRYGLDGESRLEPNAEASSCAPPVALWLDALEEKREISPATMGSTQIDALDLKAKDIDAYLTWAEENLILPNHPSVYHRRRKDGFDDLLNTGHALPALPQPDLERDAEDAAHDLAAADRDESPMSRGESVAHSPPESEEDEAILPPVADPEASRRIRRLYEASGRAEKPPVSAWQLRPGEAFEPLDAHRVRAGEVRRQLWTVAEAAARVVGVGPKTVLMAVADVEAVLVARLTSARAVDARHAGG